MMGKIAGKVRVTMSVLRKIRKQIQQVGIVPMTFDINMHQQDKRTVTWPLCIQTGTDGSRHTRMSLL